MRAVVGFTLVAAAVIALAWWVAGLPGQVSATVGETSFATSFPMALLLLVVAFLVLYAAIRLLAGLARVPRLAARRNREVARMKGDRAVTRTLVALAASDVGAAAREAERSRKLLGDTPLTLLLQAQAHRQAGQEDQAAAVFRQLTERRDGAFLGHRGLLRQATAREDWAGAAQLATQAEAAHPNTPWLQDERRTLAMRTGDWAEALRLSGPEHRAQLATAAASDHDDAQAGLKLAKKAWTADPTLAPAAVGYASRLREARKEGAAVDVLRRSWARAPHPDIAAEYMRGLPDPQARLRAAQGLAQQNPRHPESQLVLARAYLDAGIVMQARTAIDAVRAAGLNQRRVWSLFQEIADRQGNADEAQDALRQIAQADPDPVWKCGACGTQHAAWKPVCDVCQTPGQVAWVQPAAGGGTGVVRMIAQSRDPDPALHG